MDRFIVGTGRCGSTLLSRMLAEHPATLSVFEFFNGLDATRRFTREPVPGSAVAELVSAEQPFLTAVMRRGYEVPEVIYPFESGGRHRRDDPLPWILVGALPRLSDDPDALFDEAMDFLAALPARPIARQYRALFDWLTKRQGRELWIERSGSSIDYLGSLCELFPHARFLHIHRDGPEAALSMREHHAYRLPISVMYQAGPVAIGPLDLHAEPRPGDAISRILSSRPPAHYFGRYWSDQLERGFASASDLSASGRYQQIRFEDLVSRPVQVLEDVCRFFDLDAQRDGWVERAAALVRGVPAMRADELPEDERRALDEACERGRKLLVR